MLTTELLKPPRLRSTSESFVAVAIEITGNQDLKMSHRDTQIVGRVYLC